MKRFRSSFFLCSLYNWLTGKQQITSVFNYVTRGGANVPICEKPVPSLPSTLGVFAEKSAWCIQVGMQPIRSPLS